MRTFQILVTLCLVPTAIAAAQSRSAEWPLDSGSRVRIHAPIFSEKTQQGTVVRAQGDSLLFLARHDARSTVIGLQDIRRMDAAQGTHSRKMKGALIGFAVGAALAGGIAAATWKPPTCFCVDFGRGGDAAFAGAFGGAAGALAGLLVGVRETETWVPVRLPNR